MTYSNIRLFFAFILLPFCFRFAFILLFFIKVVVLL